MASPGFYTQKFAKHDGKTGEGEGVPPPLKIFCGLSRMMGKSQKGGGIPLHPPSKNNGNQVIFLKEGGYLSLIGHSSLQASRQVKKKERTKESQAKCVRQESHRNTLIKTVYFGSFIFHLRDKYELSIGQLPVGLIAQLVRAPAPVSQRSWVRFPFKPEFFSGFFFSTA